MRLALGTLLGVALLVASCALFAYFQFGVFAGHPVDPSVTARLRYETAVVRFQFALGCVTALGACLVPYVRRAAMRVSITGDPIDEV